MPERSPLITTFLNDAGWGDLPRVVVAGDASNRRYDRITGTDGQTVILMDAPPDKGEDVRPFIDVTAHLRNAGLSAPDIIAQDVPNGFLLVEDLGDALFAQEMKRDTTLEHPLYAAAVDVLIDLHTRTAPDLPRYDATIMTERAALAFDWYQQGVCGSVDVTAKQTFATAFHTLLSPLDRVDPVLIQRDYHAENLIWLPGRAGAARVGLLDYQDAMLGHPAYDLVSVVQDARRDVQADHASMMIARYVTAAGLNQQDFDAALAILGTQRNLRILGVFARLSMLYGKPQYVDLIPRVWRHIQTNLAHPALNSVAPLINDALPAPTPAHLQRLRDQCTTIPRP